jgi:hypothetical protein
MKTQADWITEIDFQLENLRLNHRKCYYGFSLEMTQDTANTVKAYFEKAGHGVVIRRCPRGLFDVTIDL